MRKRSTRGTVGAVGATALLLAACGGNGGGTDDTGTAAEDGGDVAPLEIELATWGSADHENIASFLPVFERELEERSDGAITVEHFSGGALVEDVDIPTAVPSGTVEMAWTTVNGWSGVVEQVRVFDSPALQLSIEQLQDALADDDGLGGVLRDRFRDAGAEVLAFSDLGPGPIIGTEELRVPDDLGGETVRVFSEGAAAIVEAAGGSPASIAFAEVYTALQRGTADYSHVGFQGVASQQLQEVATHGLVPASFFGTTMMGWVANLDWWDGLDDDQRTIIAEAAREAELASQQALIDGREELAESYAEAGLVLRFLEPEDEEFADWEALTAPIAQQDREILDPDVVDALDRAAG